MVVAAAAAAAAAAVDAAERTAQALEWLVAQRRDGRARDPRIAAELIERLALRPPPATLHIVGTNGKGTVTHLLAAMAQAEGLKVGRFTSPHVEDFRERIAINGELISSQALSSFVARAQSLGSEARAGIGFFEWTLAMALEAFDHADIDLAVVEAGVGARSDATLCVPNVIGTVLTNVTLDHVETLGPTVRDIALDKSAVARAGVPLVSGASGEALEVVHQEAARVGAPLWVVTADHPLASWPEGAPHPESAQGWPPTRVENARLALALGRILGWSEKALSSALSSPPPPARFERFRVEHAGGSVEVLLDGAHDPTAGERLARAMTGGYVLLFGSLARRRGAQTLEPLRERAAALFITAAEPGEPLLAVPSDVGQALHIEADIEAALNAALGEAQQRSLMLLVCGSLHLAGVVRPLLRRRCSPEAEKGAMLTGRWDASVSSA